MNRNKSFPRRFLKSFLFILLISSGRVEASSVHPAETYYNWANDYYLRGETQKSLENLEIFLKLRPRDAEALYNFACLKLRKGEFVEAEGYFLKALEGSPSQTLTPKINEALLWLKDLRTHSF